MKQKSHRDAKVLAHKAMIAGAVFETPTALRWTIHGKCTSPIRICHYARPEGKGRRNEVVVAHKTPKPLEVTITAPCRKCGYCMRRKRESWAQRACTEANVNILSGSRIWLGTLTLSDGYLFAVLSRARHAMALKGTDFDTESEAIRRSAEDREIYRDIKKFFKRLRTGSMENDAAEFRYLCVREYGELRGREHYHILLHEAGGHPILQSALLAAEWPGGFVKWKLKSPFDRKAVTYACKYLAKQGGRVRASKNYGKAKIRDGASHRKMDLEVDRFPVVNSKSS